MCWIWAHGIVYFISRETQLFQWFETKWQNGLFSGDWTVNYFSKSPLIFPHVYFSRKKSECIRSNELSVKRHFNFLGSVSGDSSINRFLVVQWYIYQWLVDTWRHYSPYRDFQYLIFHVEYDSYLDPKLWLGMPERK